MTNAEAIATIRAKIERRIKELDNDKYINLDAKACRVSELGFLKRFLDSLAVDAPDCLNEMDNNTFTKAELWVKRNYPLAKDDEFERLVTIYLSGIAEGQRSLGNANAPEGLDEAAKENADLEKASYDAVCRIFGCDPMYFGNKAEITAGECDYLFRAGAEWAFGQGYSQEYRIQYNEGVSDTSTRSRQMTFTIPVPNDFLDGDNMIVQIRKK